MEQNPILKLPLSLDSEIPLYSQLMGIIKRSITSGALKVGDLLPSEAELCRAYDISRNTCLLYTSYRPCRGQRSLRGSVHRGCP